MPILAGSMLKAAITIAKPAIITAIGNLRPHRDQAGKASLAKVVVLSRIALRRVQPAPLQLPLASPGTVLISIEMEMGLLVSHTEDAEELPECALTCRFRIAPSCISLSRIRSICRHPTPNFRCQRSNGFDPSRPFSRRFLIPTS